MATLERQPRAQLENTRVVSCGDLAEPVGRDIRLNCFVLSLIEGIEALSPELKPDFFAELEPLEQRYVPVVTPGANHGTPTRVAPGERGRNLFERVLAEPCILGLGIFDFRYFVGKVRGIAAVSKDVVTLIVDC